jgi:AcrR family transcriptional regulator
MTKARRTQAERRAETRAAVLESACRLFGSKGYAQTSLEEIASACGLTIRPIYHYFGNKLALFTAVNEVMEERIVASMQETREGGDADPARAGWRAFLELCRDPEFRRIALVDAPNVLGRRRMTETPVTRTADALLRSRTGEASGRAADLATRMLMAALAEAALSIAESDDPEQLSHEADELVARMLGAFSDEPSR